MKKLLSFLFGYTEFCVPASFAREIWNFSNGRKIPILFMQVGTDHLLFRVSTRFAPSVLRCCKEQEITVLRQKAFGAPKIFGTYKHRAGLLLGIAAFFLVLLISPLFLWEVNIVGLERLSSDAVRDLLATEGVYVGAFSPHIDRDGVYAAILRTSEEISWLSVNIRGSTANIEIVERAPYVAAAKDADGANIVAKKDGRITDMQITRGSRTVQNGAIVQKGELLVSGVYDTAKFGTRYVHAKAEVFAEVNDQYTVEIPLRSEQIVYGPETILETDLHFFSKTANIFKKDNKITKDYDIINRKESLSLYGLERLPIFLSHTVAFPYIKTETELSLAEAIVQAKREIERQIEHAGYTDLLASEESYAVQDDTLVFSQRVYAIQNIAAINEFMLD